MVFGNPDKAIDLPRCGKCREQADTEFDLRGDDHLCAECVAKLPPAERFVIDLQDARRRIYKATMKGEFSARCPKEVGALRRILNAEFGDLEARAAELFAPKPEAVKP